MNTVRTKTVLKSYFETGDKPTESQFDDLITSLVSSTPDVTDGTSAGNVSITAGDASSTGNGGSITITAGDAIGSGTDGAITLTHPTGASITIGTDGRITLSSPTGVTLTNTTTGDSVVY